MLLTDHSLLLQLLLLTVLSSALGFSCDQETNEPPITPLEPAVTPLAVLLPLDGAREVDVQQLFRWNKVSVGTSYEVTLAYDSTFVSPLTVVGVGTDTVTDLSKHLVGSTVYFLRVVGRTPSGKTSTSPTISFRTKIEPLAADGRATNFYVSITGADRPDHGSFAKPFRSVGFASRRVPPGDDDTIRILPGVYVETEVARLGLRTSLLGAGIDQVTLISGGGDVDEGVDPNNVDDHLFPDGTLIQLVSPGREVPRRLDGAAMAPESGKQVVAGLTISGARAPLKCGLWVQNRNDVTLRNIKIKGTRVRGAVVAAAPKAWFQPPAYFLTGIHLADLEFENCGSDLPSQSLGNLNLAQLDAAVVERIRIRDNNGYGIKFIYDGYFRNLILRECDISVNETDKLWGEDISIELWNLGPGNEVYEIECNTWLSFANHPEVFGNPTAYDNLLLHDVHVVDGDGHSGKEAIELALPGVDVYEVYIKNKGFGVAVWDMGRSNIRIRNSIFYNDNLQESWAGAPAVYIDNSRNWAFTNIKVVNNVFDGTSAGVRVVRAPGGKSVTGVTVANNAFFNIVNTDVDAVGGAVVSATHNIKFASLGQKWTMAATVDTIANILGDPGYLYAGPRSTSYYRPVRGSRAVDMGIDVGLPYLGLKPDIGYAELSE